MKAATRNYLFWIGAFILMFGIVLTLSTMMSIYSSRYVVSREISNRRLFLVHVADERLAGMSFTPPYGEIQTRQLARFFEDVHSDEEILRVRIWIRNGYVKMEGTGVVFEGAKPSDRVLGVLNGQAESAHDFFLEKEPAAKVRSKAVDDSEEEEFVLRRRLAIFIPLYSDFSNRANAAIETVEDSEVLLSPVRRVQKMIWLITIFGLGLYPTILIVANVLYIRHKEKELEIIKAKQLEAVNSMVVTFNHEVNQPLTGICTYAELLRKATKDDEDLIRFADKISEQSIRLGELIKKISDITRVEMTEYVQGKSMIDLTKSADKVPPASPNGPSEPE